MERNHFMIILLLDTYFKIKGWIHSGILEILVKKSLDLISFPSNPPNFEGNENFEILRLRLGVHKGME